MQTVAQKPFLTFVRTAQEQPPLRVVKVGAKALPQSSIAFPAMLSHDQLLAQYQSFIDAAIDDYRNVYRQYTQRGGKSSFYELCWTSLLNDAAEETERLINEYTEGVEDKTRLWQGLKQISEGCLLVLDRAIA